MTASWGRAAGSAAGAPSPPSPPVRDTVDGWRVWYTRPAEEQLTLYSAIHGSQHQWLRRSNCLTRSRLMNAVCSVHGHAAPAAGCVCGLYAVSSVVDGLYRVRAMAINIRQGDPYDSWFPYGPGKGMVPVIARVRLYRAVDHNDQGTWSVLASARRIICTATPVLRAASAEITRVFVPDDLVDADNAVELSRRLAAGFGVDAVAGFPTYTAAEWDSRPVWMRTEPWRTSYAVDTVMSGFSRDGYRSAAAGV